MLPAGLHGSFTSEYLGPAREESVRAQHYDIREGVSRGGVPVYSAAE
jgi:hypothetical protein